MPHEEADRTRRGYDLVAIDYAAQIADELRGKPLDRALLDVMLELVEDGILADVGCGPGHVAAYLSDRGARLVGFDLSPRMCTVAHQSTSLPFAAADMTAMPVRPGSLAGIVSLYAVIHLGEAGRAMAYREFARSVCSGGHVLISFHTSDAEVNAGGTKTVTAWWGHEVNLDFHYLDPGAEVRLLAEAGLELTARLDREPIPDVEHPSRRSYLLLRRP